MTETGPKFPSEAECEAARDAAAGTHMECRCVQVSDTEWELHCRAVDGITPEPEPDEDPSSEGEVEF